MPRKKQRFLQDWEKEIIWQDAIKGVKYESLAMEFGVHVTTVMHFCRNKGLSRRPGRRTRHALRFWL